MNETTPHASVPWSILLVDDEPAVKDYLRKLLSRAFPHASIFDAADGREGLRRLGEHRIDLIVTDQRMPVMDGLTFLRFARLASPRSARIVLTGYADLDVVLRAINEGHVDAFFQKPLVGSAFVGTVGELLGKHHELHHVEVAFARAAFIAQRSSQSPFVGALMGEER